MRQWVRDTTLRTIGGGILVSMAVIGVFGLTLSSCLPHSPRVPRDDLLLPLPAGWVILDDEGSCTASSSGECWREWSLAAPDEPVASSLEALREHLELLGWEIDSERATAVFGARRGEHLLLTVRDGEERDRDVAVFSVYVNDCCGW